MPVMIQDKEQQAPDPKQSVRKLKRKRCRCFLSLCTILLLLLITFLLLALTVFKPKQPIIQTLSATVQGVASRISFPIIHVQLNVTLSLHLLVENRNRVSFKHGPGKTLFLYRDTQVAEADLPSGIMPARVSTTLPCHLTLQIDNFASDVGAIMQDILAGQIAFETQTRIPGKIVFLGIFKKHIVATLDCQITVGFPSMKVQNQECRSSTKL